MARKFLLLAVGLCDIEPIRTNVIIVFGMDAIPRYVAVFNRERLSDWDDLKAAAVLFDQFVPVDHISREQNQQKSRRLERLLAEEDWLTEQGVLVSMERTIVGEGWHGGGPIEVPGHTAEGQRIGRAMARAMRYAMQGPSVQDSLLRAISATLDEEDGCHVTTLLNNALAEDTSSTQSALFATINLIPTATADTPWERIIDFRNDPDTRRCLVSFHRWFRQFSNGPRKSQEIAEELESLVREYEHYMDVHQIKTRAGTLESVITNAAEVAEDLVKFKWGKLAKALFSVHQRRVSLLEAELSAPGREIALIARARQLFGQSRR